MTDVETALERALAGGPERHRQKAAEQGKLPVRERVARLLDDGSFVEEGLLANWQEEGLGADGVVTGSGTIGGRPVSVMANDPTVKAGSWGPKTVEKIIRIQERALAQRHPMIYLVDSGGAARDGSSTRRSSSRASSRRSACSSGRARRAARTSPPSATS